MVTIFNLNIIHLKQKLNFYFSESDFLTRVSFQLPPLTPTTILRRCWTNEHLGIVNPSVTLAQMHAWCPAVYSQAGQPAAGEPQSSKRHIMS